jgi:3-oxo-5-alpha-steroid 4-dehydrogenase 3
MVDALFNSARTVVCVVAFFYNSYWQYQVHKYLASLTSYQVPSHPVFLQTNLICPHYGFEIQIYVALAILTAKDVRVFNVTMVCAVGFVIVNLGVTADGTKKWLMKKFPKQRLEVAQRHRMFSIW